MFVKRVLAFLVLVVAASCNGGSTLADSPCECRRIYTDIFIDTDIEAARERIEKTHTPCKHFYRWFISTYVDFNIKTGVESLYRSLYSTCPVRDLAYLVYANKLDRKHNLIGESKEVAYYFREVAKQVFNDFFKSKPALFAKWEFADLERQGENKKIIDFISTLRSGGDEIAAESLLSLIKIGHVQLDTHIDFLKECARKGNPDAMGLLGNMYYYGWGVPASKITARHYFSEGARSDEPDSLNGLGMLSLEEGDPQRGKAYLEKASAMGSNAADYNLFLMHEKSNKSFLGELHLMKSAKQDGYLPAVYKYAEKSWEKGSYKQSTINHYKSISIYYKSLLDLEKEAIRMFQEGRNISALYLSILIGDLGSQAGYINAAYTIKNRLLLRLSRMKALRNWDFLGLFASPGKNSAKTSTESNSNKNTSTDNSNKNISPGNTSESNSNKNTSTENISPGNIPIDNSTETISIENTTDKTIEKIYVILCKRLAEVKSADAFLELGDAHYYGIGVDVNMSRAFSRYYAAALMGSTEGKYLTGWMYEMGCGIEKDFSLAKGFYERMHAGDSNTYVLYWVLILRIAVKEHISKAVSLLVIAASVGLGWIALPQGILSFNRVIRGAERKA
ncbi:SEL1 protein [Nematocida major]|uniref:SEL1 protein n=1 Tax=Nematocida major TaxID=1912982 RepID=UPI0020074369|nr:SEL1 protein [Nematocida major]KAH9385820.1 SEL1 protein [Nematocida major]